jgi:preprotein translocase subunit Sec61beta
MADNKIQMPGAFGGLMRYDEEYTSKFTLTPTQIIIAIAAIILLILVLKLFFPVQTPSAAQVGIPTGQGGFIIPLLSNLI